MDTVRVLWPLTPQASSHQWWTEDFGLIKPEIKHCVFRGWNLKTDYFQVGKLYVSLHFYIKHFLKMLLLFLIWQLESKLTSLDTKSSHNKPQKRTQAHQEVIIHHLVLSRWENVQMNNTWHVTPCHYYTEAVSLSTTTLSGRYSGFKKLSLTRFCSEKRVYTHFQRPVLVGLTITPNY